MYKTNFYKCSLWLLFFTSMVLLFSNCRSDKDTGKEEVKQEVKKEQKTTSKLKKKRAKKIRFSKEMSPKVTSIPTEIERNVFKNPHKYLPQLVEHLSEQGKTDADKVKLFHDWITNNLAYDVSAFLADRIRDQSYETVIKNRKSVCEGNANVLKKMCDLAGIESVKVTGYSRGYGQQLFDKEDFTDSNHAWNAIKIDGEWQLVDATWDAGHIDGKQFNKKYSTNYLFIEPEQMLYTHFPDDPKWQLMDKPINAKQAAQLPDLRGRFFAYGLSLVDKQEKITNVTNDYMLKVNTPKGIFLSAHVIDRKGNRVPNTTFVQQQEGNVSTVHFLFPTKGEWLGRLYVRTEDEEQFTSCADFGFINSTTNSQKFPKAFETFQQLNGQLKAPLLGPLKAGTTVDFEVVIPNMKKATVVIDGKWNDLESKSGNRFVGSVQIPKSKAVQLFAAKGKKDTDFKGILEWTVEN